MGIEAFDRAVVDYLSRPAGSTILYDEFLTALSETNSTAIKTIESQFEVR